MRQTGAIVTPAPDRETVFHCQYRYIIDLSGQIFGKKRISFDPHVSTDRLDACHHPPPRAGPRARSLARATAGERVAGCALARSPRARSRSRLSRSTRRAPRRSTSRARGGMPSVASPGFLRATYVRPASSNARRSRSRSIASCASRAILCASHCAFASAIIRATSSVSPAGVAAANGFAPSGGGGSSACRPKYIPEPSPMMMDRN